MVQCVASPTENGTGTLRLLSLSYMTDFAEFNGRGVDDVSDRDSAGYARILGH